MPTPLTAPRPAIYIDSQPHPALSQDLIALRIEHSIDAPAVCTARFRSVHSAPDGQPEYRYFGLNDVNFGHRCTVWLGVPPSSLVRLFDGRVNLIEGDFGTAAPPSMVLQAEDALQSLRMRSRTRVFEGVTDTDIIEQIASEHGLSALVHLGAPAVMHARIAQLHQSNLTFLLDRVAALGAMLWVDQQQLVVRDSAWDGGPGTLTYGERLQSFTVRADVRDQATQHGVTGWDFTNKAVIARGASDADLLPESGGGRSGGQAITESFEARRTTVVTALPASEQEAAELAAATHRDTSAGFVTGTGVAVDVPTLRVGHAVDIAGVGPLFSDRYQVIAVRHSFDGAQGLRTEFDVRSPRLERPKQFTNAIRSANADRDQ